MLIVGIGCMLFSLEIVIEITNLFPEREYTRGYIVWRNIIIEANIALLEIASLVIWFLYPSLVTWFLHHVQ